MLNYDQNFLSEAATSITQKNSVLFVGSGFSIGAKNILNQKIVGSYKLRDELLKGIGLSEYDDYTLNDASEKYIDKFGEAQLIDLLKNNFSVSITTDDQNKVCSLPWKRIYTSNYDDVVEMSGKLSSKHYTPITINDDPKFYKDKSKLCIHLNGYINNLTPKTLYSSFKLTDVSYLTTEFVNSEWITLFRSDIQTSDYVFFIGFSLNYDLDLKRILYTNLTNKNCVFIVTKEEKEANIERLSKFGKVYPIGTDGFSNMLKELEENRLFKEPTERTKLYSFTNHSHHDNVPALKDKDFVDLLVKGSVKLDILQYSITDPINYPYYIFREKLHEITELIEEKNKYFIVHSDLGNGKSLFINGLSHLLVSRGYNVFIYKKYTEFVEIEIETICTKMAKPVIIIENYSHYFNVLKLINTYKTSDLVVILSDRSIRNDSAYYNLLDSNFIDSNAFSFDLNRLTTSEIDSFINHLDHYGLWGEYAGYAFYKKTRTY